MPTPNLPPPRPDIPATDSGDRISKELYDLLNQMVREIKKIEAGLDFASIPY